MEFHPEMLKLEGSSESLVEGAFEAGLKVRWMNKKVLSVWEPD